MIYFNEASMYKRNWIFYAAFLISLLMSVILYTDNLITHFVYPYSDIINVLAVIFFGFSIIIYICHIGFSYVFIIKSDKDMHAKGKESLNQILMQLPLYIILFVLLFIESFKSSDTDSDLIVNGLICLGFFITFLVVMQLLFFLILVLGELLEIWTSKYGANRTDDNIKVDIEYLRSTEKDIRPVKTALLGMPNLFLISIGTLLGLYLLLGLIIIAAVEYWKLPIEVALGIGAAIMVTQFLFGPKLMDFTLNIMFKMQWVSEDQLPDHLFRFVEKVCKSKGITFPHFGIIDDGAPQAFTYGHTPRNARIVLSRGILDLLEPEEAEAVVAHELGHAIHWDMLLMTLAQLIPLIMYYIYRTLIRADGENNKDGTATIIAVIAYVLYWISSYLVLSFSRIREYYADRFSGQATGNPGSLASALVKIAYGLAGMERNSKQAANRNSGMAAVSAMGIFDEKTALSLALTSYAAKGATSSRENIQAAMCWDLWNPWARWYELNSTHPLVAKRLNHLGNQSLNMGQCPYITFNRDKPESYWDEFILDIIIYHLPFLMPLVLFMLYKFSPAYPWREFLPPGMMVVFGLGLLIRYYFSYPKRAFPEMSVAALLSHVKVSDIRPVPCTLTGKIIGRGVPGLIISEDFVMRDDSGIIFLDLRQPLRILELLFGIMKAGAYQGQEVVARGWYRRSPVPYVELLYISHSGRVQNSWVPVMKKAGAIVFICIGTLWGMALMGF